jgi:hypothetical protein
MTINKKRVGADWTWFDDYVYVTAKYTCFTPPGRRVQVGTGVFFAGQPRGEKVAISGKGDFRVIGLGAIHIRIYDGGPDCEVAISQDSNVLIPVLKDTF